MSNLVRRLTKGEYLFREGEASEEMYVIKSGKVAIVKMKGTAEILLVEKTVGQMVGEMAFFDNRPRSAAARAVADTELIVLAFSALNQQFNNVPDWLKVMVKTINNQLREANSRIKNLETATVVDEEYFTPHLITRLCAILSLIGFKSGVKTDAGLEIPYGVLRDYCIQIFQAPTNKMDRLLEIFTERGLLRVDDLGEGQKRVTVLNHKLISDFTDWYNRFIFTEESRRITVDEREMNALRALAFYGARLKPDIRGNVNVNLTEIAAGASRELGFPFGINEADPFVEKGLAQEKRTGDAGVLTMQFNLASVTSILPFWELVYALRKAKR